MEKLDIFVIVYLNDILIYIKYASQGHVEAVRWVFGELQRHSLFANLKKGRFYQEEVCFLGYIVSSQGICMKEKRIKAIKTWHKLKLVQDI